MPTQRLFSPYQRFFVMDYETTGLDENKDEPIEVGIVICAGDFSLIDTYESLIAPKQKTWTERELGAFKVHGIYPSNVETAPSIETVGAAVAELALSHTVGKQRPVIVSDNAQFEHAWTERLMKAAQVKWPFHYCTWDTSLFLEAAGIGDPKPAHRALRDAGLLHAAILRALQAVRR